MVGLVQFFFVQLFDQRLNMHTGAAAAATTAFVKAAHDHFGHLAPPHFGLFHVRAETGKTVQELLVLFEIEIVQANQIEVRRFVVAEQRHVADEPVRKDFVARVRHGKGHANDAAVRLGHFRHKGRELARAFKDNVLERGQFVRHRRHKHHVFGLIHRHNKQRGVLHKVAVQTLVLQQKMVRLFGVEKLRNGQLVKRVHLMAVNTPQTALKQLAHRVRTVVGKVRVGVKGPAAARQAPRLSARAVKDPHHSAHFHHRRRDFRRRSCTHLVQAHVSHFGQAKRHNAQTLLVQDGLVGVLQHLLLLDVKGRNQNLNVVCVLHHIAPERLHGGFQRLGVRGKLCHKRHKSLGHFVSSGSSGSSGSSMCFFKFQLSFSTKINFF